MVYSDNLIVGKMPDFTRAVLFLDFDDVINLFGDSAQGDGVRREEVSISLQPGTNLRVSAQGEPKTVAFAWRDAVVDALRGMNAVWLTSWKSYTQNVLNPLFGFDFGYVDWFYRGLSDGGFYGKAQAVAEVVERFSPPAVAVADNVFTDCSGWSESALPGIPVLVVAPQDGLTDEQLAGLSDFMSKAR